MNAKAKAPKRGAPAESAQLSVRVTEHIEKLITAGRVQPGERLNELALAERLGVSRAPVREAMRSMEGRGWLTRIANRGMFVRELSVKEMLDIFDMRALLVGYAAERAAELLNAERRKTLAGLLDQMDKAAKSDDGARYYRLNAEYHDAILAFSNNQRAVEVYAELAKDLHRFQRRYFDFAPNMVKSNAEHRALFDAIVSGDGAQARRLSEQHVQQGKLRVLQTLESD
jgi:DNA-binding GntR family transcriptional regulator